MICKECGKDNIVKAKYCTCCGSEFTDLEREEAYAKTFFGKLTNLEEKVDKIKGIATLEIITGNPIFRGAVLVLILVIGIFLGRTNGNEMTILEGKEYQVQYNTNEDEYYVLTELDKVALNLYFPRTVEEIFVSNDSNTQEMKFTPEDIIELDTNHRSSYLVKANYGDAEESIRVYVLAK